MPFAFLVCLSWQRRDTRTSHTPLTASTQFSVTAFRGSPGQEKDGGKPDDGDYIVRKHNQITHGRTALIALRHNAAGTVNEALSPCRFTFPGEDLWPGLGAVEEPRLVRRGPSFGRAGSIVSPSNRRRESFLKERLMSVSDGPSAFRCGGEGGTQTVRSADTAVKEFRSGSEAIELLLDV